jgi:hypothetical protein
MANSMNARQSMKRVTWLKEIPHTAVKQDR